MSDTTAMIDVTATMLPRTVMNERSFADQMASSAIFAESRNLFNPPYLSSMALGTHCLLLGFHLHLIAVGHAAHGVVRAGDDLVAFLQPGQHLEVLVAGNADFDGHELGASAAEHEHALGFFARLSRFELRRRRSGLYGRRRPALVCTRLSDDLF